MRAWRLTGWQRPPEFQDVPEPDPRAGEVLVRVAGSGACHSDLVLMHEVEAGMLPFDPPFTLGHEVAGWVEALGDGVQGIERGQPVAVYGPWGCGQCLPCSRGRENYCEGPTGPAPAVTPGAGLGLDGGMAPYLLVPGARHLVPLGDLDPVRAAPLTDAGLTPYAAVKPVLPLLGPGSTALVIGVGGLGHLAIQIIATMCPARIVAVDTRSDALRQARDLGAVDGVPAGPAAAQEVMDLTKGRGADVVLDLVGTDDSLALAMATVRKLGHVVVVGAGGGSASFSFFSQATGASLTVSDWGSLPELREVIALAAAGRVHIDVTEFGLGDVAGVYDSIAAGTFHGRAVIVPGRGSEGSEASPATTTAEEDGP
jgi:propanol-preferring alcohol dehydrogenase